MEMRAQRSKNDSSLMQEMTKAKNFSVFHHFKLQQRRKFLKLKSFSFQ